jgi:hypothetical protein
VFTQADPERLRRIVASRAWRRVSQWNVWKIFRWAWLASLPIAQ